MGTLNLGNGASFTGGSNGFLSDAPKGQIIQIQHGILKTWGSGAYDTSSPSVFKDTGLSVTITPTSTSSTILLQASFMYGGSAAGENHYFRIVYAAFNSASTILFGFYYKTVSFNLSWF